MLYQPTTDEEKVKLAEAPDEALVIGIQLAFEQDVRTSEEAEELCIAVSSFAWEICRRLRVRGAATMPPQ